MNKPEKPMSTLWGCELTTSNKEECFKADDTNHQHQLALRTMCLGHTAKDEFNIVELLCGEETKGVKAVPIATLHAKSMTTVSFSGLDLHQPVTFRLKHGSGPVFVGAEHVALEEYSEEEEMDDDLEEEEEEEDIEESPVKKVTKNGAGKRKKPEKADDEVPSDTENPPKKGKGRGRKAKA